MVPLVMIALAGAGGVVSLAALLSLSSRVARWGSGARLAAAHSLTIIGFLVVAPLYVWATWGSPYGDVYVPYLLVPGIHIYHPANRLFAAEVFHWLLRYMDALPASILYVIVGPGLVGVVVGGLQWWLIGTAWDRLSRSQLKTHSPAPLNNG